MVRSKNLLNVSALGPKDEIGEGDSSIYYDLIDDVQEKPLRIQVPLNDHIFYMLCKEVVWQEMYHVTGAVPRLVAVQGATDGSGFKPVYRHPSDKSLPLVDFTPSVQIVRQACEKLAGHTLNHALIQLYRNAQDNISEHSDKTLDITRGSKIVNASFGARRTMRLRRKNKVGRSEQRETQRILLMHNSAFVLGPMTNQYWLHGINADKRMAAEKDPEELAFDSVRVSITFRNVSTFLNQAESMIWGQGAIAKSAHLARPVVCGNLEEIRRIIHAFGTENHQDANFDWADCYGAGFDVLHLSSQDILGKDFE